ncbi:hypothetical protein [Chryseobacterium koreense]|uniref:hypothetical protein n=1 Tax=Chryseobacterium koreense TaxID=232216 RepID=UPI0026F1E799|nr:hypothetical protein [Chryseobacterium koreense]
MKKISILTFLFFFVFYFAQIVDVKILKTSNDTINGKMKIFMSSDGDRVFIGEDGFYRRLRIVDENGKQLFSLKPNEIKKISFKDLKNKETIYEKDPDKNQLMKLVYDGKMKIYKQFIDMTHYLGIHFHYVQADGKPYKVGLFENDNKILTRITSTKPELKAKIDAIKNEEDIAMVMKEFEE